MSKPAEIADLVLYHTLSDDDCAEVRRFIVQQNLMERVQFRNIDRSEEAAKDLLALQGNATVPLLVFDQQLYRGKALILQFLKGLIS